MANTTGQFYDVRTINHGTHEVNYGPTNGGASTSNATGITKFTPSTEQDQKVLSADAQTHLVLTNPSKVTIKTEQYQHSDDEMLQSGQVTINGGFADGTDHPTFSVQRTLYKQSADGTTSQILDVYYGCSSSAFTESDDEDSEDAIAAKKYTRTITVGGVDMNINGKQQPIKHFQIERTDENATVFDTHVTKILTPSDFDNSKPATK